MDILQVQKLIESTLSELGLPDAPWICVKETSSGHSKKSNPILATDGVLAVWLADQGLIKFHDHSGNLLKTAALRQSRTRQLLSTASTGFAVPMIDQLPVDGFVPAGV